jgi:hypothetical protein
MKFISELLNESLICSELTVKDYKELLKCSFGDEPNKQIFIETITDIFAKLTNKPQQYFKEELSIIDLFCFLLDVKINSQGDSCMLSVTKDEKQMTLELNLERVKNEIKNVSKPFSDLFMSCNGVDVVFDCPSVSRLLDHSDDEYLYFIKSSTVAKNTSKKTITLTNNDQARLLFDSLSPKMSLQIIEKFEQFVKAVSTHNFLSHYGLENQKLIFIPSIESLIWFTKLMFNEPLDVFYDNLFYLGHLGHINLEYVDGLTPGEYLYMIKKLEHTLHAQNPQKQQAEDQANFSDDAQEDGLFEDEL